MLEVRHITFAYKDKPVLSDVSFRVRANDFVVLRGESGQGKSTLLRLLARLEVPQSGELLFNGKSYEQIESRELRRHVTYLHQRPVIIEGSIRENLLLGFRFQEQDQAPPDDELRALLRLARLEPLSLDASAMELSIGQQQRLALLRLLLIKPDALLLDEPTASLDALSAQVIMDRLSTLHRDHGTTIVLVTHGNTDTITVPVRTFEFRNSTIEETTDARRV